MTRKPNPSARPNANPKPQSQGTSDKVGKILARCDSGLHRYGSDRLQPDDPKGKRVKEGKGGKRKPKVTPPSVPRARIRSDAGVPGTNAGGQ